VKIPAPHGHLEASLRKAEGALRGAAVLCHPHPQHGGTMHTKAVFRAAQALNEAGFHVLRFNFRGVGTSTGSYDQGKGEQDDARAALDWLAEQHPELPLILGGFSFGARVALRVGAEDERPRALMAMGLAVTLWDFEFMARIRKPVLVVQGENDEFGSGEEVARALQGLGTGFTLRRIGGTDHFFNDRFDELREAIVEYFTQGPGAEALPVLEGAS
jgi:uncharacterized protein